MWLTYVGKESPGIFCEDANTLTCEAREREDRASSESTPASRALFKKMDLGLLALKFASK